MTERQFMQRCRPSRVVLLNRLAQAILEQAYDGDALAQHYVLGVIQRQKNLINPVVPYLLRVINSNHPDLLDHKTP